MIEKLIGYLIQGILLFTFVTLLVIFLEQLVKYWIGVFA